MTDKLDITSDSEPEVTILTKWAPSGSHNQNEETLSGDLEDGSPSADAVHNPSPLVFRPRVNVPI